MDIYKTCDGNCIIPAIAKFVGCESMVETKPRIFVGDRSEILDYCKENNLIPEEFLVRQIIGDSKTNLMEVKIVPSKKGPIEREINFVTDKNITYNDYVYVCMVSEKIELNPTS